MSKELKNLDRTGFLTTTKKRSTQKIEEFRQNRIFDLDQKKIYAELNGNGIRSNDVPNVEEFTKFWDDIWGVRKEHNREADG